MSRPTLRRHDARQEPSLAERIVMTGSALFTVLLLAYVAWHAATHPDGVRPTAQVVGLERGPNSTLVHVELVNEGDVGLLAVGVEVRCDDPAPAIEFANVPAGGRRKGLVVCPPGEAAPEVAIAWWLPV